MRKMNKRNAITALCLIKVMVVLMVLCLKTSDDAKDGRQSLGGVQQEQRPHNNPNSTDLDRSSANSSQESLRTAVIRPFTPFDIEKMVDSFTKWDSFMACDDTITSSETYDLYLVYSQSLQDNDTAQQHVNKILQLYQSSQTWPKCFGNIETISIGLQTSEDYYDSETQDKRSDWVAGPNAVFRHTFRIVQSLPQQYQLMFWMEADATPLKPYWLDSLSNEAHSMQPFAILGSSYRGDKWDNFLDQMPTSMLKHLNGNALYNLTSEVNDLIFKQLESEEHTTGNAIAFDHRIAELVLESQTGIPTQYPKFDTDEDLSDPDTSELMEALDGKDVGSLMKETPILGNYAGTHMVARMFPDELVIAHGAIIHSEWDDDDEEETNKEEANKEANKEEANKEEANKEEANKEEEAAAASSNMGDITLIISDEIGIDTPDILTSMESVPSYINQVLLVVPEGRGDIEVPSALEEMVVVVERERYASAKFDVCSMTISTQWFMSSDSYHRLKPQVPLMVEDGKVVTTYISVQSALNEGVHLDDIRASNILFKRDPRHVVNDDDFVFHTLEHEKYCEILKEPHFGYNAERKLSKIKISPSATTYVAYMEENGVADGYYEFVDANHYGSRSRFVYSPEFVLSSMEGASFLASAGNNTNGTRALSGLSTGAECLLLVSESECVGTFGCEYRPEFGCREDISRSLMTSIPSSSRAVTSMLFEFFTDLASLLF